MLQQFKDRQSWVQPARRITRQQEICILYNIMPDNPAKVVQSMTIFRVQPAGRNTGQKLTLQLGRGRTKPKEAKGRNRKEASEPGPSTVTMQPLSAQDGKTLPASQWCIASFRQGAANRAHTSVTGGKQPMVRFFFVKRVCGNPAQESQ